MSIRFKPFDEISVDDLKALISNEVTEQIYLEYKRDLPGNADADRKEFLKDVSSFANSRGGIIIYGMDEDDGLPKELVPIPKSNADEESLRLTKMVENGIRPRIQGFRIRDIPHSSGNCILIAKIPQSFNRPHMVDYKNRSKFYSRHSKGVFQMDVDQIKEMVLSSQDLGDRIREFRKDRVSSYDRPVSIAGRAHVEMHIVPLNSFGIGKSINLSEIETNKDKISILGTNIQNYRYNFDGIVGYHSSVRSKGEYNDSYVQVYRNGCIEMARSLWDWEMNHPETIPAISVENWILKTLYSLSTLISVTEIDWPISVAITLTHVIDHEITLLPWVGGHIPPTADKIDREAVLIPEVIIEDITTEIESVLLPAFNTLWNAAAWPKSGTYDEKGIRKEEYHWSKESGFEHLGL